MLPELVLLKNLRIILQYIKVDYDSFTEKKDTFLYSLIETEDGLGMELEIEGIDIFAQLEAIFIKELDNPRKIDTRLSFDISRAVLPTIHIGMPSEEYSNTTNGIGQNEGAYESEVKGDQVIKFFKSTMKSTYHLIFTSDNSLEVSLMYHVIKNALFSYMVQLDIANIRNMKLSGNDLQLVQDFTPPNVYTKALNVNFEYDNKIRKFDKEKLVNAIKIVQKIA